MLLAGCHALDALRWLAGDEVVEVTAISNNKRGDFEYDPNVVAVMKFRSGMIAKSSTLFDCEMPYTFNIDLVGVDGDLRDNRLWSKKLLPGQTNWAVLPTVLLDSATWPITPSTPRSTISSSAFARARVALQHRRRLPHPRVVFCHRPLDRTRRQAGRAAVGLVGVIGCPKPLVVQASRLHGAAETAAPQDAKVNLGQMPGCRAGSARRPIRNGIVSRPLPTTPARGAICGSAGGRQKVGERDGAKLPPEQFRDVGQGGFQLGS